MKILTPLPTIIFTFGLLIVKSVQNPMGFTHQNEESDIATVELVKHDERTGQPSKLNVRAFGTLHELWLVRAEPVLAPGFEAYVAHTDSDNNIRLVKYPFSQESIDRHHSNLYTDTTGTSSLFVEERDGQPIVVSSNHLWCCVPSLGQLELNRQVYEGNEDLGRV